MSDKGLTMDEAQKRGMARRSAERAQLVQAALPSFEERRAALRQRGRKPRQAPKPRWLTKHDLVGVSFAFHSITMQEGKFGPEGWVVVERDGHPGEREGLYLSGARIVPVLEEFGLADFEDIWTLVQRGTTSSGLPILELIPAPLDLDAADPMSYPHVDGASA